MSLFEAQRDPSLKQNLTAIGSNIKSARGAPLYQSFDARNSIKNSKKQVFNKNLLNTID